MVIKIIFLSILCLSILIFGCSTLPNSKQIAKFTTSNTLQQTHWQLVEVKDLKNTETLKKNSPILEFTENKISGSDGCNRYIGSYNIEGNKIKLFKIVSTAFPCLNEHTTSLNFKESLKQVKYYKLNAYELILLNSKQNIILKFEKSQ